MKSTAFSVTVNGQPVDAAHAAASYDWVSFDITGPVDIAVTADEAGFWDHGVDIQPWRLGIRPVRDGKTIRFHLAAPAKLSISRPGDFLNHAAMLFLFAGTPPPPPPTGPKVTVIPAGVHHQSLNPKSGDTIYLAPGAFVFGSICSTSAGYASWGAEPLSTRARRTRTPTKAGCRNRTGTASALSTRATCRSTGSPASSAPAPGPSR
jgi:hypothetical protein